MPNDEPELTAANLFRPGDDLETSIHVALGAASVCWQNPEGAGVFLSERYVRIGDLLVARVRALMAEQSAA